MFPRSFSLLCVVMLVGGLLLLVEPAVAFVEIPICTRPADQTEPATDGQTVVWADYRHHVPGGSSHPDIYGYDLATGTEFAISVQAAYQYAPDVDGSIVAWRDDRSGGSHIYGYDLSTSTEFAISTPNGLSCDSPAVSGDIVVWTDERSLYGERQDIYGYDLSKGLEFPVCTHARNQVEPAISGDIVVWRDYRNGNWDIYGYDLSSDTEFEVTTNAAEQVDVDVSNDTVVWADNRNGNWDIFGYDVTTGTEFAISTGSHTEYHPRISGDLVVWLDGRNGNADIYGYDLSAGGGFPIRVHPDSQNWPDVGGEFVVWQDYRDLESAGMDLYGAYVREPSFLGDMNDDGHVNGLDVDLFVHAVINEPFNLRGDMNQDGVVTGLDVAPFVAAVIAGGATAVPEPSTLILLGVGALGLLGYVWRRRRCLACAAAVATLLIAGSAQADVFNMGGTRNPDGNWTGLASLETVPVGNPGNAGELSGASAGGYGPDAIVGSVSYTYNIGKYEVTCGQYTEFLNAVAKTDTYGLYNTFMSFSSTCIERSGTSGSFTYSVAADRANRPVNSVSWGDAARFCNWLSNGQPTGAQGTGTTEDGSYYLNGDTALTSVTRKPGATWVIPTEDEWYKAAYYDPNKGGVGVAGYWDYPTKSDTPPINTLLTPDPSNHANFQDYFGTGNRSNTLGYPYYTTLVGDFENSASPYGTFDQGGNVQEWNETAISGARGERGGQWMGWSVDLQSSYRFNTPPTYISGNTGFRVESVPEPLVLGDMNDDGHVNGLDVDPFVHAVIWEPFNLRADMNGDGAITGLDVAPFVSAVIVGGTQPVPEPTAFALAIVALLGLLGRRRKGR